MAFEAILDEVDQLHQAVKRQPSQLGYRFLYGRHNPVTGQFFHEQV